MKLITNRIGNLFGILGITVLAIFVAGCSTTKQTENMLSAAGFKMVPAATPEQKAHLKSLPPGKITAVQRNGTTYFTYPDAAKDILYVGQQAQYDEYKKLQLKNQIAMDQLQAAELNSDPAWNRWGVWPGAMPVPILR